MTKNYINVGIVGLGYWGPNLLRNLITTPGVNVVAGADLDQKHLSIVLRLRPNAFVTTDYQALLQQDIDALVIATPPSTHFQIGRQALLSGKHVLIEKPLTTNYKEAGVLIRLAQKMKLILMVDHIFVYSPPVMKLKELLNQKILGEIYYFDSTRVNLGLLQQNTNVLWDLACHDLSILDYLFSDEPAVISCTGRSHTKNGQIDMAYLTLQYRSNFLAHIHVNWLAPTKIRRIVIGGSKKMVIYDEGNVEERIKIYDKSIIVNENFKHSALVSYRLGEVVAPYISTEEALASMCREFVSCIRTKRQPLTDGFSGAKVVKLMEVANSSLRLGKTIKIN